MGLGGNLNKCHVSNHGLFQTFTAGLQLTLTWLQATSKLLEEEFSVGSFQNQQAQLSRMKMYWFSQPLKDFAVCLESHFLGSNIQNQKSLSNYTQREPCIFWWQCKRGGVILITFKLSGLKPVLFPQDPNMNHMNIWKESRMSNTHNAVHLLSPRKSVHMNMVQWVASVLLSQHSSCTSKNLRFQLEAPGHLCPAVT